MQKVRKSYGWARRLPCAALVAALAPAALGAQLTIRLTSVPAGTPPDARVHVAGSFNGWNPGDSAFVLVPQPDGARLVTLPGTVRGSVEFKLTLGSWETVETTAAGADVPNRAATIPDTGRALLDVTVAAWRHGPPPPKPHTASRSVRVLSDSFAIPQLGRTRRVWIYLPPDYATSKRRYPVLYLQDGQNLFDEATSNVGEWGVDETLDSLHAAGDAGAIVVGVDHGGPLRLAEYNPWPSADPKLGGGDGDAYVEFLVRTLKPYVDAHYRTRADRAHTGIGGSSAGALIALYAAVKYPRVFGRAALFSNATWLAEPHISAYVRAARPLRPAPRFYMVSGDFETSEGQPARDQRRMVDTLRAAGFPAASLRSLTPADGKHSEWFWRREFPAAYVWLFDGDDRARGARRPCR